MDVREKLLEAGITHLYVDVEGGNDEGGGYPSKQGLTEEQAKVLDEIERAHDMYDFVDQFVDLLGYGSFAGEFTVSGQFLIDVEAEQMVPGSWHGTEGSMSYEDF